MTTQVQNLQRGNFLEQSVLHLNETNISPCVFFFFLPPSFCFHLFPNFFGRISSLSIRVSAPQNPTIKRGLLFSNKSLLGPVCYTSNRASVRKQCERKTSVWRQSILFGKKKKMLFLAIIKKENHNRHSSWLPRWIFRALYTSKDSWFSSEMKHTEVRTGKHPQTLF